MAEICILCYVTDRSAFAGDERFRRLRLLDKIAEAAGCGVDYIQLREKDLSGRELEALAKEAVRIIREHSSRAALLINSRTDVALASGADGVHLPGNDVSPADVRRAWEVVASAEFSGREVPSRPVISVSCHTVSDVAQAAANTASLAVFAPVFEKAGAAPSGIEVLSGACHAEIPVLALGGVTVEKAASCMKAGAAGIAGIRLFQENDVATVVRALREK
jgi:thiamine-phosphate pyrophosphorylase